MIKHKNFAKLQNLSQTSNFSLHNPREYTETGMDVTVVIGANSSFSISQGGVIFKGTYKVSGNKLVVTMPGEEIEYIEFKVTGDTMTWYDEGEAYAVFKRVK